MLAGIRTEGVPVSIENVTKSFGSFRAINGVSIDIEAGTIVSLLGPSGCGKTTVLRMVAGLETLDTGTIRIGDRVLNDVPIWKRGIGMVFQSYALFPHMTVAENVGFGLRMRGLSKHDAAKAAMEAMDLTRISGLQDRLPSKLSGGQRQRVALARAIVISPSVLLLDEPLGALDKKLREQMQVEIKALQRRVGLSTLIVTHDQDEALTLSDRVVVMSNGQVEQVSTPQDIYKRPKNTFVADFLGAANLLTVKATHNSADVVNAELPSGKMIAARYSSLPEGGTTGSDVRALVRPENIRLSTSPQDDMNVIPGKISNILFGGANTMVIVETADLEFKVSVPATSSPVGPTSVGDETFLVWSPEDTTILEQ